MSEYEVTSDVAMSECDFELLEELARGRAGDRAVEALAHVSGCDACRDELAELRRERVLFATVAPASTAPLPAFSAVLAATQAARASARSKAAWQRATTSSLAAAAAVVLAVGAQSWRGSLVSGASTEHSAAGAGAITAAFADEDSALYESENSSVLGATCGDHAEKVCALSLSTNAKYQTSKNEFSVTGEPYSSIRRNVCE